MLLSTLGRRLGLAFVLCWLLLSGSLTAQAQVVRSGYLQQGFEDAAFPPAGWNRFNVSGSNQWSRSTTQARTGSASAHIQYQTTAGEDWLILPHFRVAASDSVTFWMRLHYQGYPPDSLVVRVSATDSLPSSFMTIRRPLIYLREGVNYPPNSTRWYRYAASLAAFAGQKVYVAFKHYNNYGDGLYLDDITLGTRPAADVAVTSIALPTATAVGQSSTPQATVVNNGSQTQSFPVALTIGSYTSTRSVVALAPGASTTLSFDVWTPSAVGTLTATATATLAADAVPADNQLSRTVSVYSQLPHFSGAQWRAGVDLPGARWSHGLAGDERAAVSGPGPSYLYATTGSNASFALEASMTRYNSATGAWETRAALPVARQHAAAHWVKGKLYVAGGYTSGFNATNRLDIYDSATDTWSQGPNMPTGVGDYASGVYRDSLLYLIGGYSGSDVTTVQVYNSTTNAWTTATPFAGTAAAGLRASIVGNQVVVAGGYNQSPGRSLSQAWLGTINPANPAVITWSALPDYPGGTRSRLAAGSLRTGSTARVYFAGGDPSGAGTTGSTDCWAYDLLAGSWLAGPALRQGVNNVVNLAPLVQQDSVYLVCAGGYSGSSVVSTVQRLNLGPVLGLLVSDLVVSTARNVPGDYYRNITVTGTGDATLTGSAYVTGTARVESGGRLRLMAPLTGSGNLDVQAGARLDVYDPVGLSASGATGSVRVSGSRVLSPAATYAYTGPVPQQTGPGLPAQVRNLIIANIMTVALSQATAVEQVLRCESGLLTTDAASGRTLTLLSDASTTATALVAAVGGSVGGDGGVLQRRLDAGINAAGSGYRHYASPVGGLTVAGLSQPGFAPVVNPAYNTAAQPGLTTPFPTLFTYDETRVGAATPTFEAGYRSPAASSSALPAGYGFSMQVPSWLRVDFKGVFNAGTFALSNLTRGTQPESGWHLLGNPYPAPLDWSLVAAADRPGLEAAVYVVQSTGAYTGQYRAYVNGVGNPLIPAGQGFFVRTAAGAAGAAGALTFRDAQRVTTWGAQPLFQRQHALRPTVQLTLAAPGRPAPFDEAYVYCEAGATPGFDGGFDAWKLPQSGPGLGLQAPGATGLLSISGLPELAGGAEVVVPLTVLNAPAGPFTLRATLSNFPAQTGVFVRDRLRGTLHSLTTTPTYSLSAAPAPGQLELVLRPASVTGVRSAAALPALLAWPNPAQGSCQLAGPAGATVTLIDALGRQVGSTRLGASGSGLLDLAGLRAGVYLLRAGAQTTRLVVE